MSCGEGIEAPIPFRMTPLPFLDLQFVPLSLYVVAIITECLKVPGVKEVILADGPRVDVVDAFGGSDDSFPFTFFDSSMQCIGQASRQTAQPLQRSVSITICPLNAIVLVLYD